MVPRTDLLMGPELDLQSVHGNLPFKDSLGVVEDSLSALEQVTKWTKPHWKVRVSVALSLRTVKTNWSRIVEVGDKLAKQRFEPWGLEGSE